MLKRIGDIAVRVFTVTYVVALCYVGAALIPGTVMLLGAVLTAIGIWVSGVYIWYSHLGIVINVGFVILVGTLFIITMSTRWPFKDEK